MPLETIARYRVGRLIGAGGMGEVYLAEDEILRRKVALKLLPHRFTQDSERVRRFQREARAASALNHPNIITIYEVGQSGGVHYMATEYIEGETLRERLASRRLTLEEVIDIAAGIASALTAAHDAGIIHRDIKPENIMLRPDGYVKVLDFGLAKLADGETALTDSTAGAVMGTLLYISPEQARGQQPDARSDLYSLGACMYEMLTGKSPAKGDNFLDLAVSIASDRPEPPSTIAGAIPPELDRIVMKALEKERDDRYPSARQMLGDLQTLRKELEFENKLSTLDSHRSTPGLAQQPTMPMLFPPHSSSGNVLRGRRRFPYRAAAIAATVVIAVAVAVLAAMRSGAFDHRIDSVAVLPFANPSGNPNDDYLSDGISDSVIDSLSQLPNLQVVARSTVGRYKGKSIDPLSVGKELHVRGVVTGQLIRRGDTIVVRTALTDVQKGTQVWGEQFDRRLSDVLALQKELSEEISRQLRSRLSGDEVKRLSKRSADNSEAFQAYMKGRYFASRFNDEAAIRKGIDLYNQAIAHDPTYALAYVGIAQAYYQLSNLFMSPKEAMPRVREAAQKALALDDSLPEAHSSKALVQVWFDWDFAAGEREFRRAMELNPNDADVHRQYGDYLVATGQFDRGIAEKRTAERLDPLSLNASWDVGRALYYAGRFDEAVEQAKRTLELDPRFPYGYYLQGQVAAIRGRKDEALAMVEHAMQLAGRTQLLIATWGFVNARLGNTGEARKAMQDLNTPSAKYRLPLFLARIHAALGENDDAFRYLDQVYRDRSESMVWLRVDPTFERLHRDRRWSELLARVKTNG
jgi:serine/threonine-protein kinase